MDGQKLFVRSPRHFEKDVQVVYALDTLIAGHALSLNVVLVTHNVAEFKRVKGLRLDDWLKAA